MSILHGDCLAVLPTFAGDYFDAIVTDPPAGIAFMNKSWDKDKGGRDNWIAWMAQVASECLRVVKPGAHALVWALPRTSHWTATAWENGGWEVRDRVSFIFGTGFPKSLNLDGGIGTALKPALEDWWLLRKPIVGTVAANIKRFATGALNIDACRIDPGTTVPGGGNGKASNGGRYGSGETNGSRPVVAEHDRGRWPANLITDGSDEIAALFPESDGSDSIRHNGAFKSCAKGEETERDSFGFGDTGSASRFFYGVKATRADREEGLDRYLQVSYADPSWVNEVLSHRLLAVTGLSPQRVTEGSTIRDREGSAWSMCWCGSLSTDPFHPAIQSITSTVTSLTTGLETCKRSARRHTNGCMADVFGRAGNGGSHVVCVANSSPWELRTGISASRGGHCTEGADLATCVESWLRERSAEECAPKRQDPSRDPDAPGGNNPRNRGAKERLNHHCCVKPTSLMRYLCKLITPAGGHILDPFAGSGSTGKAAALERYSFIGIEQDPDFCEIARARIAWAEAHRSPEQLSLLGEAI